jgi:hypothetical protein
MCVPDGFLDDEKGVIHHAGRLLALLDGVHADSLKKRIME